LPIDCGSDSFVTYDAPTRAVTWQFARILPDGDYTATVPAGNVLDVAGNPILTADLKFDFFDLAGDANRDRIVDIRDPVDPRGQLEGHRQGLQPGRFQLRRQSRCGGSGYSLISLAAGAAAAAGGAGFDRACADSHCRAGGERGWVGGSGNSGPSSK
jgi:hypothetical protein